MSNNKVKNVYNAMGKEAKDECYTSYCEADKLAKYLLKNNIVGVTSIIWQPFDNELSNMYKAFKDNGFENIILTNLENGQDFYIHEPKQWDIIITNPPFSGRTALFNRLLSFGKPFIVLQATQMFNNQYAVSHLCNQNDNFKFLLPRSRMNFITYNAEEDRLQSSKNGAAFYSFWLCYKTKLEKVFNAIADSGQERKVEKYDISGNVIKDNHFSLFNLLQYDCKSVKG